MILDPVLTGLAAETYIQDAIAPILLKGLTELFKSKPEQPVPWLADWLLKNNPNKPIVSFNDE
jgi:nucleoside diphosphate kinase homolog 5